VIDNSPAAVLGFDPATPHSPLLLYGNGDNGMTATATTTTAETRRTVDNDGRNDCDHSHSDDGYDSRLWWGGSTTSDNSRNTLTRHSIPY
jgi:hypothetical protein